MAKVTGGRFVWGLLAVASMLAPVPAHGAVSEADLTSPSKALAVFCKALESGEAPDLAAASFGDAKQQDWVSAEAGQLKALKDLEAALAKRFGANYATGEKGKEAADRIAEARDDDLHTDLAHARLGENKGEVVVVEIDEALPDDHQGRLVRVDGRWKIDLASLSEYMAPDDVPVMKAVAGAATALAREIAAGKFAEIDDAADAVDERLSAAVDAALAKKEPATRESPRETSSRHKPVSK